MKLPQLFGSVRWFSSVVHMVWAVGIYFLLAFLSPVGAAYATCVFFYVREVVEYQVAIKVQGQPMSTVDLKGWFPYDWVRNPAAGGWYQVSEGFLPMLVAIGLYQLSDVLNISNLASFFKL